MEFIIPLLSLIITCLISVVGLQHKKATSERREWLICKLSVLKKKHWWQGAVRLVLRLRSAYILLTRCLHYRVALFVNKRRPVCFLLIFVTQFYNKCMLARSLRLRLNGKVVSSQSFMKYEKCKLVLRQRSVASKMVQPTVSRSHRQFFAIPTADPEIWNITMKPETSNQYARDNHVRCSFYHITVSLRQCLEGPETKGRFSRVTSISLRFCTSGTASVV